MASEIKTSLDGSVFTITLNRPEVKNAMNFAMVDALVRAFKAASEDDAVRIVVIRGAGGIFCAGGDLKDMGRGPKTKDDIAAGNRRFGDLLEMAQRLPKLLICVAEGAAMGGGFGLACVADVTIADKACRFGMPEATLGLIPAQIAPFVCARIGLTQTRALALTGALVGGEQALGLGLVHYAEQGKEAVEGRLNATVKQALKVAPDALKKTKTLLLDMNDAVTADTLDQAAALFADALTGEEGREGTSAFAAKRPPRWTETNG